MQIGLVIYGSLDTVSGGYLYDQKLVNYLITQGDDVEIISLPWRNYFFHLTDNLKGNVLKSFQKAPFDIVIQDELNHPSLFLINYILSQKVDYPFLSLVHHLKSFEKLPFLGKFFIRKVEKIYLKSIDGFIFNSETTQNEVYKFENSIQFKPRVIAYPGGNRFPGDIQLEEIIKRGQPGQKFKILFLGNVIRRKGLDVLINALELIPSSTWELNIIGNLDVDKIYSRKMIKRVSKLWYRDQIRFFGAVSDNGLDEIMAQSHLLVVPSYYEGFGIVYLEGMKYGLPAIGTTSGGAKEIIHDGENGFLIEAGDSPALASILARFLENRDLLIELSLGAKNFYHKFPTWEESMGKIRRFMIELVSNKGLGD